MEDLLSKIIMPEEYEKIYETLEKVQIAMTNGRLDKAIEIAESIRDCPEKFMALASCYKTFHEDDKAFEYLLKAFELAPSNEDIRRALAAEYNEREEFDKVIELLNDSNGLKSRLLLAQAYIGKSEIDTAIEVYKATINDYPDSLAAYTGLCPLIKHDETTPCKPEKLLEFIDSIYTPADRLELLHNCLGKVYEDLGNYELAFKHCSESASMRRKHFPEKLEHKKRFDQIVQHYTKDLIESVPKMHSECPLIFVFGMPRSGTTLTEQILISHPEIETLGETDNVVQEITYLAENADVNSPDEALERYIERRIGELNSRFIIDKMCGNYHYIGMLYQLFPNAKFVYVKRDILNNCFAAWSVLFAHGHGYSYDPREMVAEYRLHEAYMHHWFSILPEGTIHQVNYKELVANRREKTKELLDYIGVEWNEACMHPERVKRNVKTASFVQVTKPVYTSSISRAEKFGDLLKPFIDAINEDPETLISTVL